MDGMKVSIPVGVPIGEKVRRLRFEKNVTNVQIAEHVGTTEAAISRLIHDNKTLCFEKMARLADFFGVSLDDLK